MDPEKIIIGIGGAVAGLMAGLLTPWVKAHFANVAARRDYRKSLIGAWRTALGTHEDLPSNFGDTHEYASLRAHMQRSVIEQFEADRTMYVPGGRGTNVRKQMLLDEIARIEKAWGLV